MFNSIEQKAVNGRRIAAAQQLYPIWEFELTFEFLRDMTQNEDPWWRDVPDVDLQRIMELFLTCRGRFGTFLYSDPSDNGRAKGFIATADGATTTFVVPRYIGSPLSDLRFPEPIGGLDHVTNVFFNDVIQPELSYVYTIGSNLLAFTNAPANGTVITADFSFFYLCHFAEDTHEYEQFMRNLWTFKKCRFQSVKLPDLLNIDINTLMNDSQQILTGS